MRVPLYCYFKKSPASWMRDLERRKAAGDRSVHIAIPWGEHEDFRGVFDFHKHPRLRLEKFICAVQQAGLKLTADIGFFSGLYSVPGWCDSVFVGDGMVPAASRFGLRKGLSVSLVPSLRQTDFREAFVRFASELGPLLSLYRGSDGPLESLHFHPGWYALESNLHLHPDFVHHLSYRYSENVAIFNLAYQTHFMSFESALHKTGIRTLLSKRPWLFAFDYKWCRRRMLEDVRLEIEATVGFPVPFRWETPSYAGSSGNWSILADTVPVETIGSDAAFPFAPAGQIEPSAISAYRMIEFARSEARRRGFSWQALGSEGPSYRPATPGVIVLAGKYFSSVHHSCLSEWISAGGTAYFPWGLPQYFENLHRIAWSEATKEPEIGGVTEVALGLGRIYFSKNPRSVSEAIEIAAGLPIGRPLHPADPAKGATHELWT